MKIFKLNMIVLLVLLFAHEAKAQQGKADTAAKAQESAAELAKKLSNPVASLISVPFQNNTDYGIGPYNGSKNTTNFQPVIPLALSKSTNLIVRAILPFISQRDISGPNTSEVGLSDITATAFFAPSNTKNGLIYAAGPVFLIPTGTDKYLGTQKFGIGPSGLILQQTGPLTYGLLFNQIWSVAGSADRVNVNQLFMQPFFAFNWKSGAGLGINSEMTENWQASTFTAYINPALTGVTKLGSQTVQLGLGPRIPVCGPNHPDFGFRGVLTLVFPK
ncbi:hypothetical protein HDF24_17905 [Mucilaginibacter sp. X4EP1]|uniref:hypothetical protein n=1 Tax=Mucilaginibacter sp. X4EP1 TaxID=2723092 RepID=UPI00216809F7|nr:hypothetical protein [Mucilaginibacter sp. X4EP1]MCS3813555.1 hypothetical protein [Mucilaginibacter sp. X4EP1]